MRFVKLKKNKGQKAFQQEQKIRSKRQQRKDHPDGHGFSEMIDGTKTEEIQEKRLQKEYEQFELKPALTDGNPTEAYLEWKKLREKFKYLEELGARLGKEGETEKPKTTRELREERLSKVAFQVSKVFQHHEIVAAVSGKGGYAVHGWLQEHCPDDYTELIDAFVLDRACLYAKKHYTPEVIECIRKFDLDEMTMSRLQLKKNYDLPNFPGITYRQVIIYANGKLGNALTWIPNYLKEFEGCKVTVNYAPANIGMLGFALWDLLLCVVLHAPGKSQAFFDAKIEAHDIIKTQDDIKTKTIHQIRGGQEPLEDQLDQANRQYLQKKKEFDWLLDETEAKTPSNVMAEYKKRQEMASKTRTKINWKTLLYFIIVIAITGILITMFIFIGNMGLTQGYTNSTG